MKKARMLWTDGEIVDDVLKNVSATNSLALAGRTAVIRLATGKHAGRGGQEVAKEASMQDVGLSNAVFSNIVGTICDCALDPALWPEALRGVCQVANFAAGVIKVTDLSSRSQRLSQCWNTDPAWLEQ